MSEDVLRAEVGELFDIFHGALTAVVPFADRAMIGYRDDAMHPDWERLAECMFDVFVRGPIDCDSGRRVGELPLARYDIDFDDYAGMSWIALKDVSTAAVVRFLSRAEPLDTVQVVDVDPVTLTAGLRRTVGWLGASFVLVRRFEDGRVEVVSRVEAME